MENLLLVDAFVIRDLLPAQNGNLCNKLLLEALAVADF
jgi:hypothetical protein